MTGPPPPAPVLTHLPPPFRPVIQDSQVQQSSPGPPPVPLAAAGTGPATGTSGGSGDKRGLKIPRDSLAQALDEDG